jgi:hypothetical protein
VVAVRWYLRYGLSYRDVEELLVERGVEVDHVTVYRWVQRFTPLLADAARFARHSPGDRWFVDEAYVKVGGVWRYVYRAVDQDGQVIDVRVSTRRDQVGAWSPSSGIQCANKRDECGRQQPASVTSGGAVDQPAPAARFGQRARGRVAGGRCFGNRHGARFVRAVGRHAVRRVAGESFDAVVDKDLFEDRIVLAAIDVWAVRRGNNRDRNRPRQEVTSTIAPAPANRARRLRQLHGAATRYAVAIPGRIAHASSIFVWNAKPTYTAASSSGRNRPDWIAFNAAPMASIDSSTHQTSSVLPRLMTAVAGITATTAAASTLTRAPAMRRTARNMAGTHRAPAAATGASSVTVFSPNRRISIAWIQIAPGSLSRVTVPLRSKAANQKECQSDAMVFAAAAYYS